MPTSRVLSKELQKTLQIELTSLPEIKQLLAVTVDGLELDALAFAPKSFIFIIILFTFGHCWFNLFQ